jgi:hypothetical protein
MAPADYPEVKVATPFNAYINGIRKYYKILIFMFFNFYSSDFFGLLRTSPDFSGRWRCTARRGGA